MEKRKILIQLDSDPEPSAFDRVVAIDAGADEVFSYGGVRPEQVRGLVHGAIFTRGAKDLKSTAFFIGGSDVAAGEGLLEEVKQHMLPQFGLRVSVLLDASGANTTAAAAVRAAARHLNLSGVAALVLGGTGPVGQRVARDLPSAGAPIEGVAGQQDGVDSCLLLKQVEHLLRPFVDEAHRASVPAWRRKLRAQAPFDLSPGLRVLGSNGTPREDARVPR